MQVINWLKFIWSLWKLYPEAKKLWDTIHEQYLITKDAPKPTVENFKSIVKESFKDAMTPISEVQGGLGSGGNVK